MLVGEQLSQFYKMRTLASFTSSSTRSPRYLLFWACDSYISQLILTISVSGLYLTPASFLSLSLWIFVRFGISPIQNSITTFLSAGCVSPIYVVYLNRNGISAVGGSKGFANSKDKVNTRILHLYSAITHLITREDPRLLVWHSVLSPDVVATLHVPKPSCFHNHQTCPPHLPRRPIP